MKDPHNMKTLTEYKKNGFDWKIIKRWRNIAIAESPGRGFEVIRIQSHNGREIAGKHFDPAEYRPSNEQWGIHGWSYSRFEDAMARFNLLIDQ